MDTVAPDFSRDTAVEPLGAGSFGAFIAPGWSAPVGPNGGYIAAIVVRALEAAVDDPQRHLRSLTLHYLRSPTVGAGAELTVAIERAGRSVTSASVRMEQDGEVRVLAIAALACDFPTAADYATPMPEVPPPAAVDPLPIVERTPQIARRFELRHALGPHPLSGGDEALSGGWIRLRDPKPFDAALLALLIDAWLPSAWSRLDTLAPAPTLDLTIHFRAPAAARALDPEVPVLARFSSTTSRDGLFEEDGAVWSPDGTLLVQGRQLALLRPPRAVAA